MGFDPSKPLRAADAKRYLRQILEEGFVDFTQHALDELASDVMTTVDAVNVLRAGVIREPEWENGAWRYRSETQKYCVVFELESEEECLVVTAWRFNR
jgi:hypothetical protein